MLLHSGLNVVQLKHWYQYPSHISKTIWDEHMLGLCCLTTERSLTSSLLVRKGFVFYSYVWQFLWGQSFALVRKRWEEEFCSWLALPGLLCQTWQQENHLLWSVSAVTDVDQHADVDVLEPIQQGEIVHYKHPSSMVKCRVHTKIWLINLKKKKK